MALIEHRGRVAKGCLTCRERKIKCDEAKPSCNRCLKGRWTCPGYVELTDLIFRNQNTVVVRNARKQQADKGGAWRVGSSTFQAGASPSFVTKPPSPLKSSTLDLESVARAYFLSSHVLVGSETLVRGQFEFLPGLLASQQSVDPALYHALNAASFAAFGNSQTRVNMIQNSRVECNLAIQAINTALRCPKTAAKDSTVIAAMLLSTFEILTNIYQIPHNACLDQLTGALALLILRGPKQVDTHLGRQIFLQSYSLVILTCIHREHVVPPQSSTLRTYMQPYLDAGDPSWRILDVIARSADLLGHVSDQTRLMMDRPPHLIYIAKQLDEELQTVMTCLPPNWHYQIFQCSDPVLVYNGVYHIYYDAWVIRSWNYIRLCRILLQTIILDNYYPILKPSSPLYQAITTNITQLSTEICATVPQHAGYLRLLQSQQVGPKSSFDQDVSAQREAGPYTAGVYSLLYPLFAICRRKSTPVRQRDWILSRLGYLGRISGISQAFAAMDAIKSEQALDVSKTKKEETLLAVS